MYFPPELHLILVLLSFLAILDLPAPTAALALVQFDAIIIIGSIHHCFSDYDDKFLIFADNTSLSLIMSAPSAPQMI